MKKLVLIDSNALVHRAFHALPPTLSGPGGIPTNAIFGFFSVLFKMIKDLQPEYIVATFDLAGPTFRHEEFAEYKAHRVKAVDELYAQVPGIKKILESFGIPIIAKEGLEADDLIGTISTQTKEIPDLQTVIMTGDLDTLQLVDNDKVIVFTLRKGVTDTITYNQKEVKKRYGLSPSQIVDFKALKGDPSDNIPGVPGIGEKTAASLIQEFKSLEELYEKISSASRRIKKQISKKKKAILTDKLIERLEANKDQAYFSKRLATIKCDADIPLKLKDAQWRKKFDKDKVETNLKEFSLYSLVRRLDDVLAGRTKAEESKEVTLDLELPITLSKTEKEGLDILKNISASEPLFLLAEGDVPYLSHKNSTWGVDLSSPALAVLKRVLESDQPRKIGHDIKHIYRQFLAKGVNSNGWIFDTKLAFYLLHSESREVDLERIYFSEFNKNLPPNPVAKLKAMEELYPHLTNQLSKQGMVELLNDIELPLSPILARMEQDGIKVDTDEVAHLSKKVAKELEELQEKIWQMGKGEFNINSPQQLGQVLFERLGLKGNKTGSASPRLRRTSKGALSTAASELEKLQEEHPIIPLILKYRELQKLKTTYIDPFPSLIDPKDNRLHTTYNQIGAATGRLSSENPNLQNIPIRTELGQQFRKAFIAEKGRVLLSCDYSQLELRLAAHISQDPIMTAAFERGEDIHTRTAAEIFEVKPQEVTKEMRRQAKVLNFGVLYGMGALGFQRASGVSRERAKDFIRKYFEEFVGLTKYFEDTKKFARRHGYAATIFGRRRAVPEINSQMPQIQAQGERIAVNLPIQGSSADLVKLGMIEVQKILDQKYKNQAKLLLQVHDELVLEVKADMVKKVAKDIIEAMESVHEFSVPIVVEAKSGPNWQEMSPV